MNTDEKQRFADLPHFAHMEVSEQLRPDNARFPWDRPDHAGNQTDHEYVD